MWKVSKDDAINFLGELDEGSVDLICTDPAYDALEKHRAVGTTTRLKVSKASSNQWFGVVDEAYLWKFFREAARVLKPGRHLYVMANQDMLWKMKDLGESVSLMASKYMVPAGHSRSALKFHKLIIWDKTVMGMGYHYRCQYEAILFFSKVGAKDRKLNDLGVPDVLSVKRLKGKPPLVLYGTHDIMYPPAPWVEEALHRVLPVGMATSLRKATVQSTIKNKVGGAWSTCWCGSLSTDLFHEACKSITKIITSSTIRSKTWKQSQQRHTNGCIAAAFGVVALGGRLAQTAEYQSPSLTITGTGTAATCISRVVVPARAIETWLTEAHDEKEIARLSNGVWPTQKPESLMRILIAQSTQPGELVVDPFLGAAATTGRAAFKLGREFLGCELDDTYYEIAVKRMKEIKHAKKDDDSSNRATA